MTPETPRKRHPNARDYSHILVCYRHPNLYDRLMAARAARRTAS
jgi:hypothetical protein